MTNFRDQVDRHLPVKSPFEQLGEILADIADMEAVKAAAWAGSLSLTLIFIGALFT